MERLRASGDRRFQRGWAGGPVQGLEPASSKRGRVSGAAKLRPARPDDGAYIRALSREAFRPYGDYEEVLSSWFEGRETVTFLAERGKKRLGFAMLGVFSEGPLMPKVAELLAIAVEPRSRGRGIGGRLLEEALHAARESGVAAVFLHTSVDNALARKLFARLGFRPVETKQGFYPKGQDALVMFQEIREGLKDEPLHADRRPGDALL